MMLDAILEFVSHAGAAQSMVGAAGAAIPFNNVVDLMGSGVGTAPPNIIGRASLFGEDPGIGRYRPFVEIVLGAAFTTSNSATATFSIQYAPDTGSAGGYLPGTWEVAAETGALTAAELSAAQVIRMDVPATPPNTPTPRYMRIVMTPPAATNFTAGTIEAAFITQGRDDLRSAQQAASNYVVA